MKIETWLPIFPGFYHTGLDRSNDCDLGWEFFNDPHAVPKKVMDLFNNSWFDCIKYSAYHEAIGRDAVNFIADKLNEYGLPLDLEYQKVNSPREYNFANDSIDICFEFSDTSRKILLDYLRENKADFENYIADRYTGRSGFIPFYSNDAGHWLYFLEHGENDPEMDFGKMKDSHAYGQFLEFFLLQKTREETSRDPEDYLFVHMVEYCHENYLSEYIEDRACLEKMIAHEVTGNGWQDLPEGVVLKIPDDFSLSDLETLKNDNLKQYYGVLQDE